MDIQHSIPAIGHHTGSIGWLADYLDNTELTVSETKSGVTALFADFPDEDGLTFLARPYTSSEDEYYGSAVARLKRINGTNFKVVPLTTKSDNVQNAEKMGVFGALTPAAEDAARKWLGSAVEAFAQQWHHDGEEKEPVTVSVS